MMVSYNLFDFGKRERAVKEARAQLGMAEILRWSPDSLGIRFAVEGVAGKSKAARHPMVITERWST